MLQYNLVDKVGTNMKKLSLYYLFVVLIPFFLYYTHDWPVPAVIPFTCVLFHMDLFPLIIFIWLMVPLFWIVVFPPLYSHIVWSRLP